MNETYRPTQLTVFWGVKDRQVRTILSELETLGFAVEIDDYGARCVPVAVAMAVQGARSKGVPLAELKGNPELAPYFKHTPDLVAELIELRTEVTILREVIGEVYRAMILDAPSLSYRQTDFKGLGVPDPETRVVTEEELNLELAALRHRLALLEGDSQSNTPVATLATLNGETPPPWEAHGYVNIIPEPRTTVSISSMVGSEGLPHDPREFRRVLEAVALCYDVASPQKDIPKPWVQPMRDVYAARTGGATWDAALRAAGLEAPTDLTPHTIAARQKLNGLWDDIPTMAEWVRLNSLSSVGYKELRIKLGQLLM